MSGDFRVEEPFRSVADMDYAKAIGDALWREYPGHTWWVNVDSGNGIATICNYYLSIERGFLLKIRGPGGAMDSTQTMTRKAIMAAGEFLERFNIARGAKQPGAYLNVKGDESE